MNRPQDPYDQLSEYYRRAIEGHVFIRETLEVLFEAVASRLRSYPGKCRLLELGSHAGLITESLLKRFPELEIVVHDEDRELVAMSRRRLAGRTVQYHTTALEALAEPVDLVISTARHHHLPHDYLAGVRRVLAAGGSYILADELCPEFCVGEHAARIRRAQVLQITGGYLLTSHDEIVAFEKHGTVPAHAVELETLRGRALWRWYRFVVDQALERGYVDIAIGELKSTHDDLITGSEAEHKFSPLVVERQFALAGFAQVSKTLIGPADDPERQSMFVYEFALA